MLAELRIKNIAVIDAVALRLAPALNVLTGETGAGKSLIVGALGLLIGDRALGDRLRSGTERGSVEGIFELGARDDVRKLLATRLDARGIEVDSDTIVLKRELTSSGRSRAWINGTPVTLAVLAEIGAQLVSVHGQHDAQLLVGADAQREVLDRYAVAESAVSEVAELHAQLMSLQSRASERAALRQAAQKRADYLRYVVREIGDASPIDGEDEKIESEIRVLAHAREIRTLSSQAAAFVDGEESAAMTQLRAARRVLTSLSRFDSNADKWLATLDEVSYTLAELANELTTLGETLEANPAQLGTLESRRDLLHQLSRKYGPSTVEVLATLKVSRDELDLVDGGEQDKLAMERAIVDAESALRKAAGSLTLLRTTAARKLSESVSELLPELGMIDGSFSITLEALPSINSHGAESVAFQVSLNGGTDVRLLSRVASGGELARIMLALSTVLARLQEVPTLVFDEVDAGVGGTVAWQVGALMRRVAAHHQVLAISHLAQIAARAHHHVVVKKAEQSGVTTADTSVVTGEERVVEIARMLGGDSDREVSRAHARELLDRGALDVPAPPAVELNSIENAAPTVRADAIAERPTLQRRGKRV
ncbi:MAG: DNA repair protein RecN [Gemmatimonadaceae bacterium]